VTGAGALGAAFLAACGGGSDSGGSTASKDKSGLLSAAVDETKNAKKGGQYIARSPNVPTSKDPMKTGAQIRIARRGYSQLFRIADGKGANANGTIDGDFAQSWELSPDKLTLTVKIDPGVGLPPIAPVNGRTADADDVLFTFERLKKEGILAAELLNEKNPSAPIASMTAPDKQTVVIKLAKPNALIFAALGTDVLGTMYIIPKEAADANVLDPARTAIGTGPYYLTEFTDASYRWKKNPNFKRAKLKDGEPYIDEIWEPVLPDPAAALAQFRNGSIYSYEVLAPDILATKKEIPELVLRASPPSPGGTERLYFGSKNADSPFKDDRMRRAYMKTIDRDAFISAYYNIDKFAEAGLPVVSGWEGTVSLGVWDGWYLDPKSKDFGPNAKNFEVNLADAKALIEATGAKTPFEFLENYAAPGPTSFPAFYFTRAEIFMGMLESSGFWKVKRNTMSWQSEWNTLNYRYAKGNFNGTSWGPDVTGGDATSSLFFFYNEAGGAYWGADAELSTRTEAARQEFDDKKRMALAHDIQRYEAGVMFNEKIGGAGGFTLMWPAVRNVFANLGGTNWMDIEVLTSTGLKHYIDPAYAPLKKA
jgi:ABC-type transport system substrate-binding protein